MSKGRVLVVDDLPDVRATVAGLLSDEGYEVCSVSSKEAALNRLDTEEFDVAVLDVRLKDSDSENRDGLVLMREIKDISADTMVIILTGYADVQMVREALQPDGSGVAPAYGFLEKSEITELPDYVDRAVEYQSSNIKPPLTDLIAQGESSRLEFKSTMRWDSKRKQANRSLQKVVAKSIAGMMNGEGGNLLIGVADDGGIVGIENDLKTLRRSTPDGFEVALINAVKTYLGLDCVPYLEPCFECVEDKQICVVTIRESPRPVFFNTGNDNEFWVRMGNSTRRLDVKAATRYIQEKWGTLT